MEKITDSNESSSSADGTSTTDSNRQILYPSQGQSIFIVNPIVVPSNNNSLSGTNSTPSSNQIQLQSLPVQVVGSNYVMGSGNNANVSSSATLPTVGPLPVLLSNGYSHFLHTPQLPPPPLSSRSEETVDSEDGDLPISLLEAYKYTELAKTSLLSAVFQMSSQLQKSEQEKDNLDAEVGDLKNKFKHVVQEKDKLEKQLEEKLAREQNESKKLLQELSKCRHQMNQFMEDAQLQKECFEIEKNAGEKKSVKIKEAEVQISTLIQTCEEKERELNQLKEINQQIVDEYWEYFTKPTTLNKLVHDQLAIKSTSGLGIVSGSTGNDGMDKALKRKQDDNLQKVNFINQIGKKKSKVLTSEAFADDGSCSIEETD